MPSLTACSFPADIGSKWSGQFENMLRVRERLTLIVPITILLIFLLLYANTKSVTKALIVLCAVPFSAVGAIWLFYLFGLPYVDCRLGRGDCAARSGCRNRVFMLMYLDLSGDEAKQEGWLHRHADLIEAVVHGAVKRVRPAMTVMMALLGLLPILFSQGTGADVMKRIAAPMVGGLVTSFLLELLVYPPIHLLWKQRTIRTAATVASTVPNGGRQHKTE